MERKTTRPVLTIGGRIDGVPLAVGDAEGVVADVGVAVCVVPEGGVAVGVARDGEPVVLPPQAARPNNASTARVR
jgi:hypothetical protein